MDINKRQGLVTWAFLKLTMKFGTPQPPCQDLSEALSYVSVYVTEQVTVYHGPVTGLNVLYLSVVLTVVIANYNCSTYVSLQSSLDQYT